MLVTLMIGVGTTLRTTQSSSATAARNMDLAGKMRAVLRRMTEELQSASRLGEDKNENATLDVGEDYNSNSRLESDWQVTSTSVRFNRYMPGNVYSLPITYQLTGTDLERVAMRTAAGAEVVTTVATSVAAFSVAESGFGLRITLRLAKPTPGGGTTELERTTIIAPRNP